MINLELNIVFPGIVFNNSFLSFYFYFNTYILWTQPLVENFGIALFKNSKKNYTTQHYQLPKISNVRLSVRLYSRLSVNLSFNLFVRLSIRLSVRPSACLSVLLSVHMSVRTSVCQSVRLSLRLYVRLSLCLFTSPFECPSFCLSFCQLGLSGIVFSLDRRTNRTA